MGIAEYLIDLGSFTLLVDLIKFIVLVALIIAIFYIASRQSRQDKGQDIIIDLLKEIRDNQIAILEQNNENTEILANECEYINNNIYQQGQNQKDYNKN